MDHWSRLGALSIIDLCVPRLSRKRRPADTKLFYNFGLDILPLLTDTHIQTTWDFNLSLGDTIKEKYENLYREVADISACVRGFVLKDEGQIVDGDGWIITSPEIASFFETATAGYRPNSLGFCPTGTPPPPWFSPTGGLMFEEDCIYAGDVDDRWRLLKNDSMDKQTVVVGCGMPPTTPTKYRVAVMTVDNLVL